MAKKISKIDVVDSDVFVDLRKSMEDTKVKADALKVSLEAIKAVQDSIKAQASDLKTQISKTDPTDVKNQKDFNDLQKEALRLAKQNEAIERTKEKARLEEIKLMQAREKAFDKYEKQLQKENSLLEKQSTLYSKVNTKMNGLIAEFKNIAIKKELNIKLTDDESKRYDFLASKIDRYDKALKATDASMGRHQRNVGNYASAYNGLGMSVSQLAREMPAFANSVGTGFMAISNNLPMFFDEIKKINDQNKVLKASGQETKSLFSQLGSSIFSVSTLLSVGVTLLTVYGADIIDFFSSLAGGNKEAEEQIKNLLAKVSAGKR
jgi:chromosome segregation ATPase